MSFNHLKCVFLFGVTISQCAVSRAQVATGLPAFGSFSGGPDIINNADLNVHLAVPAMSKGGRGMGFNYVFTYDSSIWYKVYSNGQWIWTPISNWGWRGVSEIVTGYITYSSQQFSWHCSYGGGSDYYYTEYSAWVFHDPFGGAHPFSGLVLDSGWRPTPPPNCIPPPIPHPSSGSAVTTDGSGYTMQATADPSATVYTRSGVTVAAPLLNPSGSGSLTDPNVNRISTNGQSFTDTLGLTALQITGTPPNPVYFKYYNSAGTLVTVTVTYVVYNIKTNFGCTNPTVVEKTQNGVALLDKITFPNNTYYQFTYEDTPNNPGYKTGRIASVRFPTGGTITYTYTGGSPGHITCSDGSASGFDRQTTDGTWNYTRSGATTTITSPAPDNNQTILTFSGIYETRRQVKQAGTTLLRTIDTCYSTSTGTPPPAPPCTGAVSLPIARRAVTVTLEDTTPTQNTKTETYYDTYGLPTRTDEFDFGSSTLLRKTLITYGTPGPNIHDRPASIVVCSPTGTDTDCGGSGTVQAKAAYGYNTYGNLTSETRTTGGTPATVSRSFTYSTSGVLQTATDFNSHQTTYTNTSCSNSFPTSVSMPLSLSRSFTWNCNGGVPTTVTDENNQPTSTTFDNLWRPTVVTPPGGAQVSWTYNDTPGPPNVVTTTKLTATTNRVDTSFYDGLGRLTQGKLADPEGDDYADTTYDALGRLQSASNPYRSTGESTYGLSTYKYDALGRVTKVIPPDGSDTSNNVTVVYSGSCATVTDQASKTRKSCTDALGRVTSVTEDPAGLNYQTTYSYDTLGNLTVVTQGSQSRSYSYDRLSRLTSATTPESGTTNFYYTTSGGGLCSGDPNAVCRRTDARNITTTHAYDALNRLTSKTYSDTTPAANFYYDEASYLLNGTTYTLTNTKGRVSHTSAASGTAITIHSYDTMGRPADLWQCTPFNCSSATIWNMHYNFDLAGDIASWTHPAGFTVTNTISTAERITQITSSLNDATHPGTIATLSSTPFGAISTLVNGCAGTGCVQRQETYNYNNRLQPVMIQLGTSASPNANSCIVYNYYSGSNPTSCAVPTPGTGNNGNVMGYFFQDNTSTPTPNVGHTASYTLDSLDRLGQSVATGTQTHNLTFTYDRYGNASCSAGGSGLCTQLTYNTGTDRVSQIGSWVVPADGYDAAGNLLKDDLGCNYAWDAEGRLKSVSGCVTTLGFTYNALGQRVEKNQGTTYTEIVYAAFGETLGFHDRASWTQQFVPSGTTFLAKYQDNVTRFLHGNHLGSTTFLTDYSGTVTQKTLYYPWGQLWASAGTVNDERFASLGQRDAETGLDPTQFRMYHARLYRWLSPDPVAGNILNPQSLNRYAYVLNNPCSLIDPLGLDSCNFNIAVNNAAGLDSGQLNAVEAQINAVLGAVASTNGDTVGALFSFTGKADYTLNIVNGNPNGGLGWQKNFLFIHFSPTVNAAAVGNVFSNRPGVIGQVIGTVGVHELTHRIAGIGDLRFTGGPNDTPNLMQINSYSEQYPASAANLYLQDVLRLTAGQVSALYGKCASKHPNGNPGLGGSGRSMSTSGGMFGMDIFDYLDLIRRMINESSTYTVGIPADSPLREDVTVSIGPAGPCPAGMPGCD